MYVSNKRKTTHVKKIKDGTKTPPTHKQHIYFSPHKTQRTEKTIHTYMQPLFAKDKAHGTQYGVQVDDMTMTTHHNYVREYSREWARNVTRNSAINTTKAHIKTLEKHTLEIHCIDPGMIIQKIIITTKDLERSYLGPQVQVRKTH